MDKQYLAINGALFFWLLALIAWSVDASALARLAAACALIAFLLHSQRNKINAMFIKKNKTEPQISEAATPPAINPEPEAVASKKHETTVIASGVHFVGNIVASGHVYIHGQVTGNIEAKEHLIKVMREGQVEGNVSCRELIIDGKVQGSVMTTASPSRSTAIWRVPSPIARWRSRKAAFLAVALNCWPPRRTKVIFSVW